MAPQNIIFHIGGLGDEENQDEEKERNESLGDPGNASTGGND